MEDEFDCCFDGLTVGGETPRNVGRPFSTPTSSIKSCNDNIMKALARKKPSPLLGERNFGKSNSELNNDSLLNCASISDGCGLSLKQKNANLKFSGNHNPDLSKNDSELLSMSEKLSIHADSRNEVFASKKIHKIMDVKNVFLRSRHLTGQSTLEPSTLSQTQDYNTKCSDINRVLGAGCNKVGKKSNSMVSKENYQHKVVQSSFDINQEPRNDETESSYLVACRRDDYWLNFLGRSLAHGKENEMSLALEILKKQFTSSEKARHKFSFQLDLISVQTVLGPSVCTSSVLEGAVVELSKENQCIVACDIDTPRRIALVKGDISYNYRHPGFKNSVQVTHTLNKDDFCNSSLNAQSKWMDRVMLLIKGLHLDVVAVHGQMTSVLRDHLQALGVVVLDNLSNHQLDVLSKTTGTSVVSYILDLTEHDLGKPVMIRIWDSGWSSSKHSAKSDVVQTFVFGQIGLWSDEQFQKSNSVVYSVALCGPVQDLVNDSELKFWNCVHRLRNAIEDQCVLPGGGDIERICVKHLEDIRDCYGPPAKALLSRWIQDDYNEFRSLILDTICSGFKQFIARTNSNVGMVCARQFSSISDCSAMERSRTVYDNYSCKVEGWKRAIRIVKLFLNSEYHVITGL
ncbi:Bardet-Biedl syndrome 12 [Paramuricea clavata]|uniref:Bardet-Biedl syndrome 12 n=1 Tax=Paramuricea clavata TaxID=317549 RepID=A0A7D9I6F7_PARCT|nr:Bardet-Biedl syndrome 12 [Paramuricea clavata]